MFNPGKLVDVMADCGMINSMSEGRRLLMSGAVRFDDKVADPLTEVPEGRHTIQVGRKSPIELEFKSNVRERDRRANSPGSDHPDER